MNTAFAWRNRCGETGTAHTMNRTVSFLHRYPAVRPARRATDPAGGGSLLLLRPAGERAVCRARSRPLCARLFPRGRVRPTPYRPHRSTASVCARQAITSIPSPTSISPPSCAPRSRRANRCWRQPAQGTHAISSPTASASAYGASSAYSFQRTMVESYDLRPGAFSYESDPHTARSTRRYRNGGGRTVPVSGYALLRQ